jgi:predicted phosphohydrolase
MRIRYLSDLHTEFYNLLSLNRMLMRIRPSTQNEVCVCAGDIGNIANEKSRKLYEITINYLSKNFEKVFIINGNHEYYNSKGLTIEEIDEQMASYFYWPNVHWLNNSTYIYNGVNFIGTTLWTHVDEGVPQINDTKCIPKLTRDVYNQHHQRCRAWLRSQVPLTGKNVIITHHMPSPQLVAPKYAGCEINPWFYCNMEKFIENNKDHIACWIYGHTHQASETHIHGVPMLCNPLGYPEENKTWLETWIDLE